MKDCVLKILFKEKDFVLQMINQEKAAETSILGTRSQNSVKRKSLIEDLADMQPTIIQDRVSLEINPEFYLRLREKNFNFGLKPREIVHIALKQLFRKIDLLIMKW